MFISIHVYDANISVAVHASKNDAFAYIEKLVSETGFDTETEDLLIFDKKENDSVECDLVYNYHTDFGTLNSKEDSTEID